MDCVSDYQCHVSQIHSLFYDVSDLVCQIASANKYISYVTEDKVQSYSFTLDGDTFSYDRDENEFLKYEWKCTLYVVGIFEKDCI